ncbi:MAG: MBL fold metallo-hydrolase [Actinobacteria bacterium]|nr:MBL fold metallo-hydrolase [Actinomycetota bacterium]
MTVVTLTHIGGPTVLIEFGPWRFLTDPTFDPPGGRYKFGWGTNSRKTAGPALSVEQLGPLDAVLLSHDQHGDNLDRKGRALLGQVSRVITTKAGAERLGEGAEGIRPWESIRLTAPGKEPVEIEATPCRHGPPLSRGLVGDVIGFALRELDPGSETLWISGDTVLYPGVEEVADRVDVSIALLHVGGVRFPVTGPLRYTMTAADAVELCERIRPRVAVPIHYEGWAHFQEDRSQLEAAFGALQAGGTTQVRWLEPGVPTPIERNAEDLQ